MGDKVDPNLVAPSRHAIFIRGLPGSIKVDEVRDYFCRDGHKCRVDFHSISDDKRRLFVALRFDSHEEARELKHRYHGKDVLGHDVEISWFKDLRKARARIRERERERIRMGSGGGGGMLRSSADRGMGPGGFRDQGRYFNNGPRKPFYQSGPGGGAGYMNRGGYRRPGFDRGGRFNRNSPPFHARYRNDRMGPGGGFNRRRRSFSGGRSFRSSSRMSDDYDSRSRSTLSLSGSPDRDHRERPRSPSSIGSHSQSGMDSMRRRRRSSPSSSERRMRSNSHSSSVDEDSDHDSDSDDSTTAAARRPRRARQQSESSSNSATPAPPLPTAGAPGPTFPAGALPSTPNNNITGLSNYFETVSGTPVKSGSGAGGGIVINPFSATTMAAVAPNSAAALAAIPTPSEMGDMSKPERRTANSKSPNLTAAEKRKKKKKKKAKAKRASRSPDSINRASSRSSHADGADSKPQTPPDSGDEDDEAEEGQIKENLLRRAKRSGIKKKEKERNEGEGIENTITNQELSGSHSKLMKSKKSTIEKAYKKDCKTFATVVKVLISKNPDMEDRLQSSLRDILQEIGQRCVEDLREYMRSLQTSGGVGESEIHSFERGSSIDSWNRGGGVDAAALIRSNVPRFDRQRTMAATALEEGEAEESGGSTPPPQKPRGRGIARNSFSNRNPEHMDVQ